MSTTAAAAVDGGAHILLFPYPTAGHMIPMIDLAQKLLTRGLTITILVPPKDLPLVQPLISHHPSSIHTLVLAAPDFSPPPKSNALARIRSLGELHNPILHWFKSHVSPPNVIVSDFFLGWTHHLACQLSIPRVVFSPSGSFALSILYSLWRDAPENGGPNGDQNFPITFNDIPNSPTYPWRHLPMTYRMGKEGDPNWEFVRNLMLGNILSWGAVFNSFTELERVYIEHVKKVMGHDRVWAVGPLLSLEDNGPGSSNPEAHEVMTWLYTKADDSVVYVCFGSHMKPTSKQMSVLARALKVSGVHFILCARDAELESDFEKRVVGRGFVIRGWAPQMEILRHRAVVGFVTHCGWNSSLEGISAGVVMLTWPISADQFLNAKLLVDELGVARRSFEGVPDLPDSDELSSLLIELVQEFSKEKARARKLRDASFEALRYGSSRHDLNEFVRRLGLIK